MGGIIIDSVVRIDMLDLIIFANIIYADSQSLTAILGLNAARHQSGQENALLCSAEEISGLHLPDHKHIWLRSGKILELKSTINSSSNPFKHNYYRQPACQRDYEGFLSFLRKMKRKMRRMSAS